MASASMIVGPSAVPSGPVGIGGWLDFLMTQIVSDHARDGRALGTAVEALAFAGVGIPHFLLSKRVRNALGEPLRSDTRPPATGSLEPRS